MAVLHRYLEGETMRARGRQQTGVERNNAAFVASMGAGAASRLSFYNDGDGGGESDSQESDSATFVNASYSSSSSSPDGGRTRVAWSANSTMTIVWGGAGFPYNFGHVSYITMQNDTSYSWQGVMNYTIDRPSSDYTNERSKISEGIGYVLDFGPRTNDKFQWVLRNTYKLSSGAAGPAYDPITNNCGKAFSIAFNSIRKDIGYRGPLIFLVFPDDVKRFITRDLPRAGHGSNVKATRRFPQH